MPTDEPALSNQSQTRRGYLAAAAALLGAGCSQSPGTETATSAMSPKSSTVTSATTQRVSNTTTDRPATATLTEAWRLEQATELVAATESAVFISREHRGTPQIARIAAADGTPEWQTTEPGSLSTGIAVGDGLYAGSAEGAVYALAQETGEQRWQVTMDGTRPPAIGATDEVVVAGRKRDESGFGGGLRGFDLDSGEEQFWTTYPFTPRSVKVIEDVIVCQGENSLYAYQTGRGRERWIHGPALGPGAVTQSYVAFPATGGVVTALNPETGDELWRNTEGWPTQNDILTTAASTETFVFNARVNRSRDYLYVFDAERGTQRWMTELRAIHDVHLRDGLCFVLHDMVDVYDIDGGHRRAHSGSIPEAETMALTENHVIIGPDPVVAYRR